VLYQYDSLHATMTRAQEYIVQAKAHLQGFAESPTLATLYVLADYVISRDV
jgi:geranylgeranyl pyrophosphate synthase